MIPKLTLLNLAACAALSVGLSSNSAVAEASLAEQAQNPIASLIIMPFEFTTNTNTGPDNRDQHVMTFKPVVPISFAPSWNLILRGIIPTIDQPLPSATGGGRDQGIGDIQVQTFVVPTKQIPVMGGELTWGVGPIFQFDTASKDTLGTGRNSAGINGVGFFLKKPWTMGLLASNIWSYDGSGGRDDVNLMALQPFINYNIPNGNGWYLKSAPIITANWEESGGDTWTVPVGGGFGKVTKIGTQPVNLSLDVYGYATKPKNAADLTIKAQIVFLFP